MGFSISFKDIGRIHSLAVAHARRHGDISAEDMMRENMEVMFRYSCLAVAEGEIVPGDDLIHDIYVAVTADYSPFNGEWIEIRGSITLQYGKISKSKFMKIPDGLIGTLRNVQDSTWQSCDSTTLETGEKYKIAVVFCPGERWDDPLLIVVAADPVPFELDAFMRTVDDFQSTLAIIPVNETISRIAS